MKIYRKYVNEFVLGTGYVMQPPITMTEAEYLEDIKGGIYQNVHYIPVELDVPLAIGYYQPTPAFNIITEHVCVMRTTDQTPVALFGSSADEDMLPATMHYAHLFASAPEILVENQKANDLIERIDAMIEEAMGEWISVASTWMPAGMLELAQMRDAIREYNSKGNRLIE